MPLGGNDRVAVVVDSAASLPVDMNTDEAEGLYVVPMLLMIGGKTYLDGRDLPPSAFYRMLKGSNETPTTSAPPPASFLDAFSAAAVRSSSIICLTVSSQFSSSYDSARAAVREAKNAIPTAEIAVLDTESAAGGEGLIAMEAYRAAGRGAGLEEVEAAARAVASKVGLLAYLETLYYVWKSGRVPRVAYAGASLLKIKPLLELSRGQVRNVGRPRTASRATTRMLELMRQRVGSGAVHATVMHADAEAEAVRLRHRVDSEFECRDLFLSEFSPVMGAHTGPGLLGVAFWTEGS